MICRILGYRAAANYIREIDGKRTTPILLDSVRCTGKESSIAQCAHDGWSVHNCSKDEHAGVVCQVDKGEEFNL